MQDKRKVIAKGLLSKSPNRGSDGGSQHNQLACSILSPEPGGIRVKSAEIRIVMMRWGCRGCHHCQETKGDTSSARRSPQNLTKNHGNPSLAGLRDWMRLHPFRPNNPHFVAVSAVGFGSIMAEINYSLVLSWK